MLVAAGHPIAEGPEQAPGQRSEQGVEALLLGAQQRIKVFAGHPVADLQQTLRMIEARAPDLDLLVGQSHDACDVALSHENAVAQPERADRAVFSKRENDAILGIGKIEEQRLRAMLLHLTDEIEYQRQGAQREHQPAWAAVLAKCMTYAVFARYFPIELPEAVAVDGCGIDDEARAVKGRAAVGRLLDDQSGAGLGIQQFGEFRHFAEHFGIAADQGQRAAAQLVAAEDIAQHVQSERHAARADEDDLGPIDHCGRPFVMSRPPERCRG